MKPVLFMLGCTALGLAWLGPLPSLAPGSFSAHMTVHMSVVALAAPLIALGLAGTAYDPVRRAPRWFAPIPASVVELIAVWAWHAPGLHQFARHSAAGFALEQATFLASGLLVWLAAFGGARGARRERTAQGVLALLLTSMHMTLLGAFLALPPRALYPAHEHGPPGALSPLEDQHLGGAIMLLVGGVVYLLGGLLLAIELLQRPSDRRAGWSP